MPPAEASFPPSTLAAAKGSDGATYVALINVNPNDGADVDITIDRARGSRISGEVLTASKMDSLNALGAPEGVRPVPFTGAKWADRRLRVRMPAKSIIVLTLK